MQSVLLQNAAGVPIVSLFADAPKHNPRATAYLLAAYVRDFPEGSVFLCVVDPGVGSAVQRSLIMKADNRWFVGPENGLFAIVARRGRDLECWEIQWRPKHLSSSFHGRDLYAPVAARIARGETPPGTRILFPHRYDWPDDLPEVIYIDHFGNAMTGLRACTLADDASISLGQRLLVHARTFSDVPVGQGFWYENANGLVEIAVNQGRADDALGLKIGDPVGLKK
ncbi:MAG: SAM-dependent chlorinase/fluorinase [Gammaproteobacteria bacterium]|nr:SAM-dependent chlorinase/fluorinase [Gammaproteobacteria bacterium]